jgi:hypothetical protein
VVIEDVAERLAGRRRRLALHLLRHPPGQGPPRPRGGRVPQRPQHGYRGVRVKPELPF